MSLKTNTALAQDVYKRQAYGSENEQEQNVLQALVQANGVNMDCRYVQCHHCADSEKALVRLQTMLEVAV